MKYRVGKKQKRAVLDEYGTLIFVAEKGQEDMAQLICTLLNEYNEKKIKVYWSYEVKILNVSRFQWYWRLLHWLTRGKYFDKQCELQIMNGPIYESDK